MAKKGAASKAAEDRAQKLAGEEAEAKTRKAKAEADKAVADAHAASFPAATTKGAEGKVALGDKVGMVADLVAHEMVDKGTVDVVKQIGTHLCGDAKVLLVDSPDLLGTDWPYVAVATQIEQKKKGLEQALAGLRAAKGEAARIPALRDRVRAEVLELADASHVRFIEAASASMAVQTATSLVGGAGDLVSMFRSEYEIKARDVTIGSVPLHAALANALLAKGAEVTVDGFSLLAESPIFQAFDETVGLRQEAHELAEEVKATKVAPAEEKAEAAKEARSAHLKALGATPRPDGLDDLDSEAKRYERESSEAAAAGAAVTVAEAALESFDSFATAVVKPSDEGLPPLVAAAARERLHSDALDYTHVLYAGVESSGGESITRQGVFRKTRIRFIGGAQLSYLLWSVKDKRLVAANTMPVIGEITMRPGSGFEGSATRKWL